MSDDQIEISIVSPVYKAEALVGPLVAQLREVLGGITRKFEIILVEDGCPEGSWEAIERSCKDSPEVLGLKLSRNFGQHYAISAGLNRTRGKWVVVMDCDLQDLPSEIPALLAKAKEGHDIVLARRAVRQDSWLKRLSSKAFYSLLSYLTGTTQDPAIANFGVYERKVIAAINAMPETIRYFPTMVRWVGFRMTTLDVAHASRPVGRTSYNLRKLVDLALDICLAYSDKPLRLAINTGFIVTVLGFCFAGYTFIKALRGEILVMGYATLTVSIWVLSGLIILVIGIVGLYVGKSFEGVKRRPAFIVDKVIGHAS
ncbi:MAG: glycosyltransferase family 2 protein [Flavobacteriales bacterium]|jgi:glycosyltransferase involved in cell wall biosynthesis|nr:glycosyltransferase family 2 protein [Flavobacteriales bacterium]MBP8878921.1 glycosyltransferase family 2 protein [Flavobacteriales bacterium]MBP9178790.1 glycosyltransferase family 2 protein [Flavobacteriales bacterium]HQV76752.1 glycosyltransferase family 2 protein [Flavobacteriales bacterium]